MKALNELFLLAEVLSSMSVQICIKTIEISTQSQIKLWSNFCFGSPVKLVKCCLRFWFSTLEILKQ